MSTEEPLTDARTRNRVGPWHPDRVPSLDDFEPDTNFLVRAAAGSGKTTALVARIVALVRTGVPIEDCTAITFTRKAASEMKARLYEELRETGRQLESTPEADDIERRRVRQARAELPQCFIGTIHAFCSRILREHALSAGLPPDFVGGINDREREEQQQQVWQTYLSDVWASAPEQIRQVAQLGIEPSELSHFFGELCRYPDLKPHVDGPESPPDLKSTVDQLREKTIEWSEALPDDPSDGDAKPGTVAKAVRRAQRMLDVHPMNDPAAHAEFIAIFDDLTKTDTRKSTETTLRGDLTKSHWHDRELAEHLDNQGIPSLAEDLIEPALRTWRAYVHRKLVRFVRPAVKRYSKHRRQSGNLTFQDLLICTRDLLRTNADVRRSLQHKYPRLLVDEFQDTDPVQAELLFYLTSSDPSEEEWRACTPRDGSLFIVGDDKQSIYRFRRADLDVYSTVRSVIDSAPNGEDVTLQTNFRSQPPLLRWCNTAFDSLFGRLDPPYQASYVSFEAARTDSGSTPPVFQLNVPYVRGSSSTRQIAQRNAEQIASLIREACAAENGARTTSLAGTRPGDFMVLTRNTTRLDEFADAFADRGLPYTIAGGQDVDASKELYALLTLLTCIERPHDPVARIGYLRGPLVGMSDDALYRYRTSGGSFEGPFSLPSAVTDGLDPTVRDQVTDAYRHLQDAQTLLETHRPSSAIEQIVNRLGLMARARRDDGRGSLHAGRLLRVLSVVQRLDADGYTWTTIRDELQQILDGDRSLDGMTLETGGPEAIRLLNVHKSKGLEAPVVFLADPYGGSHPKDPDVHVRRERGDVVLPVYEQHRYHRSLRFAPETWTTTAQDMEAAYRRAEEDRLLYVAATRAEDQLIVSTYEVPSWTEQNGYWAPLYPFLDDVPTLDATPPSESDQTRSAKGVPPAIKSAQWQHLETPSYVQEQVTDAASHAESPVGSPGYGKAVGTVVHRLFEYAINRRHTVTDEDDLRDVREVILAEEEAADQRELVIQMLDRFLDSSLWTRLQNAEHVHTELPISRWTPNDPAILLDGTVDLLYRQDRQWTLIDFKTDRGLGLESTDIPVAYWDQLEQYRDLWQNVTQRSLHEVCLWCADTGTKISYPEERWS